MIASVSTRFDGHPDLLDGGKLFLETACLLSMAAIATRIALRGKGLRRPATESQRA